MTEPTQVDDHGDEAVERLLSQFHGKGAIEDLVRALVNPLNQTETDLFAILAQSTIEDSVGDQLDGIGSTVGLTRGGRSDADYRAALLIEIELHGCDGTRDALFSICDGDVTFAEYDGADAEFRAFAGAITDARADELFRLLNLGRPTGVNFTFEWTQGVGVPFAFDGVGGAKFDGGFTFTIAARGARENATP